MINNEIEYILCAAIHFDDGEKYDYQPGNINTGVVLCGWRHGCIFPQTQRTVKERKEDWCYTTKKNCEIQGFLTNKNRFVERVEAATIAFKAGQTETQLVRLFSEDIY